MAYAYAPNGNCLVLSREANRMIPVVLDFNKYKAGRNFDKRFERRRPDLYSYLVKKEGVNINEGQT